MATERYVIGIDCSTTATKAVVWDEMGHSVAEGRATFPLDAPRPGWYEQDAEEWYPRLSDLFPTLAEAVKDQGKRPA